MPRLQVVLLCFFISFAQAQVQPFTVQVVPPSPNAASLGKYGEIPVGYHTGIPNVSIPLYELKGRDITVPISLSYHAGGIRVEDVASWVGLGWSLNAGGVITRTVVGLPDDDNSGYLNHGISISTVLNASTNQQLLYYNESTSGDIDFEPDIFHYNFNGKSGRILVTKEGSQVVGYSIPYSDIKFKYLDTNGGIWVVTDEFGIKYYFGGSAARDRTISNSHSNGARTSYTTLIYTSSWYLNKIVSPKGDSITFSYTPYEISYCQRVAESRFFQKENSSGYCEGSNPPSYSYNENTVQGYRLSSIDSPMGTVSFITESSQRLDIAGDNALKSVEIRNFNNELIKKWTFNYGYFYSTGTLTSNYCLESNQNSRRYRLRLESLVESMGSTSLPPYAFSYNPSSVPDRLTNSMDHWGYNNGQQNTTVVPSKVYSVVSNNSYLLLSGANRMVNPESAKAFSLERITYPTGGYTQFEFESNDAYVDKSFLATNDFPHVPKIHFATVQSSQFLLDQEDFDVNYPQVIESQQTGHNPPAGAFFTVTILNYGTCDLTTRDGCGVSIKIKNRNTGVAVYTAGGIISGSRISTIFIPNGEYTLEIRVLDDSNPEAEHFIVSVTGPAPDYFGQLSDPGYNKLVGGLRIKQITNSSGQEITSLKKFRYRLPGDTTKSSGVVGFEPLYEYETEYHGVKDHNPALEPYTCYILNRVASSLTTLTNTQGSYVGYKNVQIFEGPGDENGSESYTYTSFSDNPDLSYSIYPFTIQRQFEWRRGLLVNTKIEKSTGPGFSKTLETTNEYKFLSSSTDPFNRKIQGLKMACKGTNNMGNCSIVIFQPYDVYSEFFHLDSTIQINYNDQHSLVTSNKYLYEGENRHAQPTKILQSGSDGHEIIFTTKYALDYSTGVSSVIDSMKSRNMVALPLERQEWIDNNFMRGQILEFGNDNSKIYTKKSHLLNSEIPLNNFTQDRVNGLFVDLIPSTGYELETEILQIDPETGNILEVLVKSGVHQSFMWGYNKTLVVAEVKSASFDEIYYTSFEDATGVIGDCRTGEKYFNGPSYTIPISDRPFGSNLVMTYWYYDGTWKFQSDTPYTPTISKAGATRYDEIRVYPQGAQMTTYTYKPGIGISSITDTNNVISYYEYDSFGRLNLIKDEKGNVQKNYSYNYKQN